ncbi:MAG: DUF4288 domain-containing protein [Acidobacteriia bacterium]|nr:DUF4288 domain-containing protein [Terriglobia bacterium]
MQWYITSFVTHRPIERAEIFPSLEYWCLLTAEDNDLAYGKSLELAGGIVRGLTAEAGELWILDGLSDLLVVADDPTESGNELIWTEEEIHPNELTGLVTTKEKLRIFRADPAVRHDCNWYVCKLVFREIHDTGEHGNSVLVWTNAYIIRATDEEAAYDLAIELGRKQAYESGTHRCDGDVAHWEFEGLQDLVQTIDAPRDGGILWFEKSDLSKEQLTARIPGKAHLGAFELEARRQPVELK